MISSIDYSRKGITEFCARYAARNFFRTFAVSTKKFKLD